MRRSRTRTVVLLAATAVLVAACQPRLAPSTNTMTPRPRPGPIRVDPRTPSLAPRTATTTTTAPATTTTTVPERQASFTFWGGGPRVILLGDSLADSTFPWLWPQLVVDRAIAWNTMGSTRWRDWLPEARAATAAEPAVVVVALGTNDLWDGWQDADQVQLDSFLQALGAPPCTILVDYASGPGPVLDLFGVENPTYRGGEQGGNQALTRAAAARTLDGAPTAVASWGTAADPESFGPDQVHLSPHGQERYSAWLSAIVHDITDGGGCRATGPADPQT